MADLPQHECAGVIGRLDGVKRTPPLCYQYKATALENTVRDSGGGRGIRSPVSYALRADRPGKPGFMTVERASAPLAEKMGAAQARA